MDRRRLCYVRSGEDGDIAAEGSSAVSSDSEPQNRFDCTFHVRERAAAYCTNNGPFSCSDAEGAPKLSLKTDAARSRANLRFPCSLIRDNF
jgi:hypothetical protein